MKILFIIIITFIAFSSISIEKGDKDGWVLEKDKNDIKIWTLKSADSGIKTFKAVVIYDASVEQLAAVLNDVEAYPEWMSEIEKSEILREVSEYEHYYYLLVDAPWPLSNRDNIVHFKLEKEAGEVKISVEGHADYIPEKQGIVRVLHSRGVWTIMPQENGKSKLVFEYTADPGGSIPAWAINMFIVEGPFKTLSNLKEFVKREKYQH
jgi:ribosome-associated toxin RatA of RatAB toxin-antitoxin module